MTMSERAPDYAQGFKDGFAAGLEEGKKLQKTSVDLEKYLQKPLTFPQYDTRETCPKCGMKISGVMGYVCNSQNCPTFMQVTCNTVGTKGPYDGPEYANKVWINGEWAELGS